MCFVEVDLDEYSKFHREIVYTAKKKHKCCECWGKIEIGEKYLYETGYLYGFYQYKTCMSCREVRDLFCCSWYYTDMWSNIMDSINECDVNFGCLDLLSEKARNKFIAFYDKYYGDE